MSTGARVLVVDDESDSREALAGLLQTWGHRVEMAADAADALRSLREVASDVVVCDLVMPGMDGLDFLRSVREEISEIPIIMVSGRAKLQNAVDLMRQGAFDFLEKPADPAYLRIVLDRALESQSTRREVAAYRRSTRMRTTGAEFIGSSSPMRQVLSLIEKVAPSRASVVITGESGTGKEMVARAIHNLSPRRDKPFIAINCSAIPATLIESELFGFERGAFTGAETRRLGCFELAHGGTLFLDEVAEIPPETQAKFLRVLEEERLRRLGGKSEIEVDVRVVAATHRHLKDEIHAARFREDLFFRLNVFHIHLPPLKERRDDVPALVDHFVRKFNQEAQKRIRGASAEALAILSSYPWPGNIRELRNAVERAVILCDGESLLPEHLPPEMAGRAAEAEHVRLSPGMKLHEVERQYILSTLTRMGNNKARTAAALGISEKTLYNKLKAYAEEDRQRGPDGRPVRHTL